MNELTDEQIERQDFVDNAIYKLVNDLLPDEYRPIDDGLNDPNRPFAWDIAWIGALRDEIENIIKIKLNIPNSGTLEQIVAQNNKFNMAFYPYIKHDT